MAGKRYDEKRDRARIDDKGIESFELVLVVAEARSIFLLGFTLSHHLDFRSSTDG